jgi:ectoine hydroxylase-related dioxygenase (phytanoyl-CoA dioxygenase family)
MVVENFLDASDVGYLLDTFHSLDSATHRGSWSASMFSHDVTYRRAVDSAVKKVVTPHAERLIPDYRLCFCNFLVKDPVEGEGGVVQIHQDPTFVDETVFSTLGIWIPLVDTDARNGGITVLPGSHRWNHGPRGFGGRASPYLPILPDLVASSLELPMRAGDAMIFCQQVFHGSPPNRSSRTRVSVAVLLAQREAQLRCYHANPALPTKLEVFEVDDEFYLSYPYGTRPVGVPRIEVVDHWHEPIGPEKLAAVRDRYHVVR